MKDWIIKNWAALLVGAIISVPVALFANWLSERRREPTFYVEPVRPIIYDGTGAGLTRSASLLEAMQAPTPRPAIVVTRADGKEVSGNIYAATLYFYNDGKQTIMPKDVYSPIFIRFQDTARNEILDLRMIHSVRRESAIAATLDTAMNRIAVSFAGMEHHDGFVAQITYEGYANAELIVQGGIEGAKEFGYYTGPTDLSSASTVIISVGGMALLIVLIPSPKTPRTQRRRPRRLHWIAFAFTLILTTQVVLKLIRPDLFYVNGLPAGLRIQPVQILTNPYEIRLGLEQWFEEMN